MLFLEGCVQIFFLIKTDELAVVKKTKTKNEHTPVSRRGFFFSFQTLKNQSRLLDISTHSLLFLLFPVFFNQFILCPSVQKVRLTHSLVKSIIKQKILNINTHLVILFSVMCAVWPVPYFFNMEVLSIPFSVKQRISYVPRNNESHIEIHTDLTHA